MNIDTLVRNNVKNMSSYSSARDDYSGGANKKLIYLDANESPFDNGINRYPDNKHTELKKVISNIKNINVNQIVFGNGTDEILDLIVRVFCNPNKDKIITLPPTYGMYDVIAKTNGVENIEIPLKSDFSIDKNEILKLSSKTTKILFLCSPNNPTGNSFDTNDLIDLIKGFNGVVVVDEAYIDFSSKQSLISLINENNNLIITQTMSKAYGMAGIRLGMGFSNQKIINYLNKIKPPYNINVLTERKALEELNKIDEIKKNIDLVLNQRKLLISCLEKLDFIDKIYKSDANFLLVKVDNADFRYNQLLEKGIIVRNRSNQPLCQNCLRITIGTENENKSLIKILNQL
ncbi:histidinol-phosphate transaminase [Flavobacteriaceae bacterium]|nr:histidinol-phosphate transaminase [Flavobacteriaceae bacterium]MDC0506705.1 histidinol-phosphate transaminase [Flavobacteriaceae bacterium]MDC0554055.1 histidinol-phosphate transaminase [Flavobacteriaceae bacterium]